MGNTPFAPPLTRQEKSSIVPGKPPFTYGASFLSVHVKVDREKIRELVPKVLEPYEDVQVSVRDIISATGDNWDLFWKAPELTQYHEAAIGVRVRYRDSDYLYYPYMWVDKDFALMRGYLAGYPKKMANINITRYHPLLPKYGSKTQGTVMGGNVSRNGVKLVDIHARLSETAERPLSFGPLLTVRYYPSMTGGKKPVAELLKLNRESFQFSNVLKGEADVKLGYSEFEELNYVDVKEVVGGYAYEVSFRTSGAEFMEDLPADNLF